LVKNLIYSGQELFSYIICSQRQKKFLLHLSEINQKVIFECEKICRWLQILETQEQARAFCLVHNFFLEELEHF
jgi:hypothetical protein